MRRVEEKAIKVKAEIKEAFISMVISGTGNEEHMFHATSDIKVPCVILSVKAETCDRSPRARARR